MSEVAVTPCFTCYKRKRREKPTGNGCQILKLKLMNYINPTSTSLTITFKKYYFLRAVLVSVINTFKEIFEC
jgi:hypothetical protein